MDINSTMQQKFPAYNLQHAFITYGDLRANIIEVVDLLDSHVIPTSGISSRSFNILGASMRYSVYAVLEVQQDDKQDDNNNEEATTLS